MPINQLTAQMLLNMGARPKGTDTSTGLESLVRTADKISQMVKEQQQKKQEEAKWKFDMYKTLRQAGGYSPQQTFEMVNEAYPKEQACYCLHASL